MLDVFSKQNSSAKIQWKYSDFLPAHPASYTHNLVSRMQSFNFGGSQDAMILHDFSMKIVFRTHKFAVGPIDIESSESQGLIVSKL